jgi:hypothetical protein
MNLARTPEGYLEYLASPHWAERRARTFGQAKGICAGCGRKAEHVHHRTYSRLGQEHDDDLVAVCHDCHRDIHLHHVEHASKGLAWATDSLLRKRRAAWSLPPVVFPREARAISKRKYHAQMAIDNPARMAIRAAVMCPNCGAKPGEFCASASGNLRAGNHVSRLNAYRRAYPMQAGVLTEADIEAGKSQRGGFTREQLAAWGVPWPPPKGWRATLTTQTGTVSADAR